MPDALDLSGRVALITGGGSGIGKGAALEMAKHGARISLVGRSTDDLADACEEIRRAGAEAEYFQADVSKIEQIRQAVKSTVDKFGRLDILFANAGINGVWAPIEAITEEEYDRTMDVNLKGTFLTIQAAVPYLKRQGGSILVTSSVNGTRMFSNTGATVYSATKAGQVAMAKMLAVELAEHRVRVNVICPGAIKTNIGENTEQRQTESLGVRAEYPEGVIPLTGKRPGSVEQVGKLAVFLASDASDHITGELVFIDGGQSLVQG